MGVSGDFPAVFIEISFAWINHCSYKKLTINTLHGMSSSYTFIGFPKKTGISRCIEWLIRSGCDGLNNGSNIVTGVQLSLKFVKRTITYIASINSFVPLPTVSFGFW